MHGYTGRGIDNLGQSAAFQAYGIVALVTCGKGWAM